MVTGVNHFLLLNQEGFIIDQVNSERSFMTSLV